MKVSGAVAIVTGAGTGIGRAIARALAEDGAFVACAGRRGALLEETAVAVTAAGGRAGVHVLDVRDAAAVRATVAAIASRHGAPGILVNNAGAGGPNDMAAGEDDRWDEIVGTNLTGTYLVTKAALPHLPRGGRIVNVSSCLGRFGVPGYTAYCASKHGLIGFTRALALELAPRAITVNAICPGWVDTEMAREGMEAGARAQGIDVAAFHDQAMGFVPLGRMLRTDEIAAAVRYLVSDAADGMTGQGFDLNGGSVMV